MASVAVTLILLSTSHGSAGLTLPGFEKPIARRSLRWLGVVVSILLLLIVITTGVGIIHPQEGSVYSLSEFLLGRRFFGIVLGLLFGTLFILWARQLVLLTKEDKITLAHRLEAAALVALFAAG